MTDQQTIALINHLTGDDFCEDLNCRLVLEELDGPLAEAAKKLALVYRIAHSTDQNTICYKAHEDWRAEAESLAKAHGLIPCPETITP